MEDQPVAGARDRRLQGPPVVQQARWGRAGETVLVEESAGADDAAVGQGRVRRHREDAGAAIDHPEQAAHVRAVRCKAGVPARAVLHACVRRLRRDQGGRRCPGADDRRRRVDRRDPARRQDVDLDRHQRRRARRAGDSGCGDRCRTRRRRRRDRARRSAVSGSPPATDVVRGFDRTRPPQDR